MMMKKAMLFALSVVTGVYAFDFGDTGSGDTGSSDDGYDWTINDPVGASGSADVAGSSGLSESAESDESEEAFDGSDPFARKSLLGGMGSPKTDMSVGGGVFFGSDFGGGAKYSGASADNLNADERVMPVYGFGLHTFFDYKKYVTAGLSIYWGGGTWEFRQDGKSTGRKWEAALTSINIDALGKYPFEINDKMTAFPLLGLGYHIVVSGKTESGNFSGSETKFDGKGGYPKAIDLSALWFKFGGGLDYALNERMFLRPELFYGIRLPSSYESNVLTKDRSGSIIGSAKGETRLGHGLSIRAGVGYNL